MGSAPVAGAVRRPHETLSRGAKHDHVTRRSVHRGGRPLAQPTPSGAGRGRAPRHRPRHASKTDDRFGTLLGWTAAGAAVPGLGFLGAGRRRTAAVLLGLVAAGVVVAVAVVALAGPVRVARWVATRPDALLVAAVGAVLLGVAWCAVIVAGHLALRRGRRLGEGQRVVSAVLVAVLLVLVALPTVTVVRYAMAARSAVLTVFGDGSIPREGGLSGPDVSAPDPWAGTPRINVLLLGSDAGSGRIGTRPDTIVVASIDTQSGDSVLLSLPRNLEKAPFPPGSVGAEQYPDGFDCPDDECLLNAVWTWGQENPQAYPEADEPGLAATREVVGETLGLQIDYYALVNLQGFQDVVNALNGVEIDVERRLPIGGGTSQISGYVEPGRRVLSGYEALWYARSRADSSDYERMRRQRCVIAAVVDQADPARLALAFPDLAASAERNVETDITRAELDAFVELGLRVKDGTLRSLPFTNDVINSRTPDFAAIRALVQDALAPPPPEPAAGGSAGTPAPTGAATATGPDDVPDAQQTETIDPQRAVDVDRVCG